MNPQNFQETHSKIYQLGRDLLMYLKETREKRLEEGDETKSLQSIKKQIKDDFGKAEQQVNDYINRFQELFDSLLRDRETKESDIPKVLEYLETQKEKLDDYLPQVALIRESLRKEFTPVA